MSDSVITTRFLTHHALPHPICNIATTLFLGSAIIFLLLRVILNDSWKQMMLGELSLLSFLIGIITAIAGAFLKR